MHTYDTPSLYAMANDGPLGLPVRTKAPRVRAFSPKVRIGCITCKIRRKKCDEEKPTCRRCRDSQVKCDGYAPVPTEKKKSALPKNTMVRRRAIKHTQEMVQCVASHSQPRFAIQGNRPNLEIDGSVYDRMFFHHFRAITMVDFVRLADPKDFWSHCVLPMCHSDPSVRNAVVALGAAHYVYLQKLQNPFLGDTDTSMSHFECVATQYYNKAIGELVKLNDGSNSAYWDVQFKTLTCCLLFVCLENILGRFDEGVRHVKAGARLFETSDLSLAPECFRNLMQEIATMLLHFCVDVSYLDEGFSIPNMIPYASPLIEMDDGIQQFSSLQEAKDAMWDLDVRMAYAECDHSDATGFSSKGHGEPDLSHLTEPFERWKTKFSLLISSQIGFPDIPVEVQRETLNLVLRRCVWEIILFPGEDPQDLQLKKLYHELLDLAELLYSIEASLLRRPTFTLESDSIPALYFTGLSCEDPVLVERSTSLLRTYRRREGPWDGLKAADRLIAELENPTACPSKTTYSTPELTLDSTPEFSPGSTPELLSYPVLETEFV